MNCFDSTEKVEKIKKAQMEIKYLRNAMSYTVCPIKRQWLQSHLFDQIEFTLGLEDELYRYMQKQDEKKRNRQIIKISLEELSTFNGMDGRPAYVVVNGEVYDVSNEATWAGASHFGLTAGKDLTEQFNSCHGMIAVLSKLPKVGVLK